jgi:signal peptidase I
MKKKLIITAAVLCTILVALMITARITGIFLIFSIPTPANEPNIKPGNKIFVSSLKDPVPYSFIVFTSQYADSVNMTSMPDFKPGSHYFYRLCALPGNIVEMKNGILYVNNKNFDEKLNLNNQYMISSAESNLIEQADLEAMYESGMGPVVNKDSALVTLDTTLIKKYGPDLHPVIYLLPHFDSGPFKWNNKDASWTVDNFGPLKIPAGCYFALGDNRHNALDSRYTGFVKKENITGVVLNK